MYNKLNLTIHCVMNVISCGSFRIEVQVGLNSVALGGNQIPSKQIMNNHNRLLTDWSKSPNPC